MSFSAGTYGSTSRAVSHAPRVADPLVGILTRAAVVAPAAFFTIMLALGAVTPGYDAISRMGSELSLAPLGWIMIANFIGLGLTEIAFSAMLFRVLGPAFSGRLGAAMVTLAGAAFVVAGVFVTDAQGSPVQLHGVLHVFAALALFFVAFPIGGLAMAWRYSRQRGFAAYSALTAVATPLLFVATFLSGDMQGLMERVVIGVGLTWLTVLVWHTRQGRLLESVPEGRAA